MRQFAVAVCLCLVALSLSGATFELPTDAQLLGRADAVVTATVLGSAARPAADGMIYTDHRLRVEQVLKGDAATEIVVAEAGGFLNGRGVVIAGAPEYAAGERVLLFLRQRDDGTYHTASMSLGKYRFDGELLVRDAHGIETLAGDPVETRDARAFINAIRSGDFANSVRELEPRTDVDPPQNYVFTGGSPNLPIRWEGCETGCLIPYVSTGTQVSTVVDQNAIDDAMGAWSTNTLQMGYVGQVFTNELGDDPNNDNAIIFNFGGAVPGGYCDGSIGCAVVYFGRPFNPIHTFKNQQWWAIEDVDVVIRPASYTQTQLATVLGHELGHSLAFKDAPVSNALMSPSINLSRGAVLGAWDIEALTQVYSNAAPPCSNVSNVNVTGGGTVTSGSSATLTATASGTTPFTYQWYEGPAGNTLNPIAGATSSSYTTPPITSTKQYWVKVGNSCPSSANSNTVTVDAAPCNPAVITDDPDSANVAPNGSVTLHAAGNGTFPITWQWFRGSPGNWTPVGTNNASYNTGPLTTTTSFYVRMSNSCGTEDSAIATVTVGTQCTGPVITGQPSSLSVALNQGATLAVTATGTAPLTYQWYRGAALDDANPIAGATSASYAAPPFTAGGTYRYWVRVSNACGNVPSQTITVTVACPTVPTPEISVPALTHFSTPYNVSWTGNPAGSFEVQEATDAAFTQNVRTFTVTGALQRQIPAHTEVTTGERRFYYRVRAIDSCTNQPTAYSSTASTVVEPPNPADASQFAISIPAGSTTTFTQPLLVPGFGATATNADTFAITIDVPWLTVFPASGALSAGGTTVQLTINPALLEIGSTTATIQITRTPGASGKLQTNDGPSNVYTPFSVSMVTPVAPDPRDSNPPPGTMIIPAVAHVQGIGSPFRSDVRLVNVSFDDIEYEITFTPSQTDGTQVGKKTRLTVSAGDTIAFDDIVRSWYGAGILGESGLGTIEIRPLNAPSPSSSVASSRTYALDAGGTLGQFIPALRIDQFVRDINQDSLGRISLQQIANSAFYRTNLGFVEGSGHPVTFDARLLDANGVVLRAITRELPPFGQLQQNLTSLFGDIELTDGRVEVTVVSSTGLVSAYASVLNNRTNDPLMVFPVQPARFTAARYVLAGIAEFVAPDGRNFHSDMRIYNAGRDPVTVTLWYYDRGQSEPGQPPRQVTLAPGQVRSYNDVLPALWPGLVGGGSIVATAPPEASLVLTAQTYSRQPDGGTKGQFIPGVTYREATGLGERSLEVLQLEQSAQYRSNVGVVEVTGQPATIEIAMYEPDAKISAVTQYGLKANEYIQFDRILEAIGKLGTVYNGRVSIRVIGGEGRVYGYGSCVDNRTEDPTYVPAQ
jgi:Ig-like domain CHU_C associated